MVSAHRIQTRRDIIKPLQSISEGDSVAMPALFGVTPSTPTFTIAGHVKDINLQPDIQHIDTVVVGSEDIVNAILTGKLYAFQVTFEPVDGELIDIGFNASGGAATIDASRTFTFTERLNGTEMWTVMRGCRPTNTQCRLNQGVWEVTQTWVCREITIPIADPFTGAMYETEPTATSVSHNVVTDHFTWNAQAHPENSFSTSCTRSLATEMINGENLIVYTYPVGREIDFSVETYVKDVLIETDWEAKTERGAVYKFDTTFDFTYTNAVITAFSRTKSATNTDAYKDVFTARAEGCIFA